MHGLHSLWHAGEAQQHPKPPEAAPQLGCMLSALVPLPHLRSSVSISQILRHIRVCLIIARHAAVMRMSHGSWRWLARRWRSSDGRILADLATPERIRVMFEDLGGAYIKVGQLLATRRDLVGEDIARSLLSLQSAVPSDSPDVVETLIRAGCGRPSGEVFSSFNAAPLASGSIAQVHLGRLHDGRHVAVKVRHHRIVAHIEADLALLLWLARLAQRQPRWAIYQPVMVAADFARMIRRETDFEREARHIERFATAFANDSAVRFPSVVHELSSASVLVMDFLDGVPVDDHLRVAALQCDTGQVARTLVRVWLAMVFQHRFYHADPHPGNLLVLPGGVLGVIDCGMATRIDQRTTDALEDILVGLAQADYPAVVHRALALCQLPGDFDEEAFTDGLTDLIAIHSAPGRRLDLARALMEVADLIAQHRLLLPPIAARLLRMLTLLDATARSLAPELDLAALARPHVEVVVKRRLSPGSQIRRLRQWAGEWFGLVGSMPRQISDILDQVRRGRFDLHVDHRRLEPVVNRLVHGVLLAAVFLGSVLVWHSQLPPTIGGHSVIGMIGCGTSGYLVLRLLWRARRQM
jgi:ubiquinone biosynthesis protein